MTISTATADGTPGLSPLTWLEIDRSAIWENTRVLCQISQVALMAVVKANGHGHGAVEVARVSLDAGASWLGVARVGEGIELVRAGIHAPILVLGPVAEQDVDNAFGNGLYLSLYSVEIGKVYARRALALNCPARVHLKVDTGMGRLGVLPEDVPFLIREIGETKDVKIEGVFTHLARASEPDLSYTRTQLARFRSALQVLEDARMHPRWIHVANSAATLIDPHARFNMVRIGAALYGLPPFPGVRLPARLRPALAWKAQLASCKVLPAGWGVSYGHEYVNRRAEFIGIVPVGYADGWRQIAGNAVLVEERRTPIVGRVCMDMCMIRLPYATAPGAEVVLIGQQGSESISAEEVGIRWQTNSLDVVSSIAPRVSRCYVER